MASIRQNPDGSLGVYDDPEQKEVFRVGGPGTASQASPQYRGVYTLKMPLNTSGQGSAALGTWQNTTGDDLIVKQVMVDITVSQATTLNLSVGTSTTNTTFDVNLIGSFSCNGVAAGVFDNITDKGTNGKSRQKLAANSWITVSTDSLGSVGSFRGNLYLDVIKA